ncbi:MAG: hypothetical protein IT172_04555 [Acidobacteria bacterium]|nr:hypothetical protein [Acidobacteriota bacterium]
MKVHVYGNTLNSAFHLTKALRDKGIDAEMFLDNSSPFDQDFPWWDDASLTADNLPPWIRYYKLFPNFVLPTGETKRMIDDFAKCDVALVSCYGPMLAMRAKVRFVFYSLGNDLNTIDYKDEISALFFSSITFKNRLRKLVKLLGFVRLQSRALKRHAARIIIYMGYQYGPYIVKHGLQDKTVKLTYPKDVINYAVPVDKELYEEYRQFDSVFFMLSRHSWKSVWNDIKGNDKFIRAFARYVRSRKPNVILIMANKGIDVDASKALVNELGIGEFIQWVDDMPKHRLKKYQSLPNAVTVDNFWHDKWYERYPEDKDAPKVGFGFGCIEALASKSLLITAFKDHEFYGGESPPILDAFTEDEIYDRLVQLDEMPPNEREEMRQAGYDFVLKWHEQTTAVDTHINILRDVYSAGKR